MVISHLAIGLITLNEMVHIKCPAQRLSCFPPSLAEVKDTNKNFHGMTSVLLEMVNLKNAISSFFCVVAEAYLESPWQLPLIPKPYLYNSSVLMMSYFSTFTYQTSLGAPVTPSSPA